MAGVMYLTFGRATVAIDAKTCRERWTYIWQPKGQEISPADRKRASSRTARARARPSGPVIALNMANGSLLWSQPIASAAGGRQYCVRCRHLRRQDWIGAFKLETGEKVKFET